MNTTKLSPQELQNNLAGFYGTEQYHRYSVISPIRITDGAKYLADQAGAYWLYDILTSALTIAKVRQEAFLVLKLKKTPGNGVDSCVVTIEDGNDKVLYKQKVDYTDFPLDSIQLFYTGQVLMLPSEY